MTKLSDTKIKNAKPKKKPFKLYDEGGLYLLISPKGSKGWRFKYRFAGREKLLSLGLYPDTTLAKAREKRDVKRTLLAAEPPIDPSVERQARKAAQADSFKVLSAQWFEDKQTSNAETTRERNQFILDRLTDRLGKESMPKITTLKMKSALLAIQKHNGIETARRARGIASRVFAYAIAHGKASSDATAGLKDILKAKNTIHRAAITKPRQLGELMQKIYAYGGQPTTVAALKLLALNFTRPSELRLGKWSEIDFDNAIWIIPAERMKMRRKNPSEHLLPLSVQSVAILKDLHKLTGGGELIFPTNKPDTPLSENAFNNAIRKMGFDGDTHTAHGFRSTASTFLHELNFSAEVIETQLAHSRPGVAGIYNRSHLLPQRRVMLQTWSDHLDQLRKGGKVIPIKFESGKI